MQTATYKLVASVLASVSISALLLSVTASLAI